jgi:hypothetical protein
MDATLASHSPSPTPTRRKAPAALPVGMKPRFATTAQTRGLLGIGDTRLWRLIRTKTLETVMLGGRRMVVFESIERLVQKLRELEVDRPRSTCADKAFAKSAEKRRGKPRTKRIGQAATGLPVNP